MIRETTQAVDIVWATTPEDMDVARGLFREYAASLNVDLCFENLDKELERLPGEYAPPDGRLLFAMVDKNIEGCVALKKAGDHLCEMKRLFVRPAFHGMGIGKRLVLTLMDEARAAGYRRLRLDTLPSMQEAIRLYRRLGFAEIHPFRPVPVPGTLYMEIKL